MEKHKTILKIYYIFQILLIQPLSLNELKIFIQKKLKKENRQSTDMIYQYFNSLKQIGVEIRRLSKENDKKYIIDNHPFKLNLQEGTICFLFHLRYQILKSKKIKLIYLFDELLSKIYVELSEDGKEFFLSCKNKYQRKLKNYYYSKIEQLSESCSKKEYLIIKYNSPAKGEIEFRLIAQRLELLNDAILFYGYSPFMKDMYALRTDLILSVKKDECKKQQKIKIPFAYFDIYDKNYQPQLNEKLVKIFKNKLRYQIEYGTEFLLIQNILQRKENVVLSAPKSIRKKIIKILLTMKKDCEANIV